MEANGSSLKNFNFEGMTTEEIINKYESVLSTREKQILDLTVEIGNANAEINKLTDEIEKYDQENVTLLNKINKIEKNISQELSNKEIMFTRLQQKESEVEFLQIQLDALIKGTNIKPTEEKKVTKNEDTGFFSSAKNKMKELKEKAMGKIKKIDFSDLINNKTQEDDKDKKELFKNFFNNIKNYSKRKVYLNYINNLNNKEKSKYNEYKDMVYNYIKSKNSLPMSKIYNKVFKPEDKIKFKTINANKTINQTSKDNNNTSINDTYRKNEIKRVRQLQKKYGKIYEKKMKQNISFEDRVKNYINHKTIESNSSINTDNSLRRQKLTHKKIGRTERNFHKMNLADKIHKTHKTNIDDLDNNNRITYKIYILKNIVTADKRIYVSINYISLDNKDKNKFATI